MRSTIKQKLAAANPTSTEFQRNLALSHSSIATLMSETEKLTEAMKADELACCQSFRSWPMATPPSPNTRTT